MNVKLIILLLTHTTNELNNISKYKILKRHQSQNDQINRN